METRDESEIAWLVAEMGRSTNLAAITLNFKQGIQQPHGWEPLTTDIIRYQIKWLLKNVDKSVFGNGFKRAGRKTARIVSIEGQHDPKRLHAHLAVEIPRGISPVKFLGIVESNWAKARWAYGHGDFDLCEFPDRWISYILKTGPESIDYENTHLTSH